MRPTSLLCVLMSNQYKDRLVERFWQIDKNNDDDELYNHAWRDLHVTLALATVSDGELYNLHDTMIKLAQPYVFHNPNAVAQMTKSAFDICRDLGIEVKPAPCRRRTSQRKSSDTGSQSVHGKSCGHAETGSDTKHDNLQCPDQRRRKEEVARACMGNCPAHRHHELGLECLVATATGALDKQTD